MSAPLVRLTDLAHGGGCGCKLAPAGLQHLLANQPPPAPYAQGPIRAPKWLAGKPPGLYGMDDVLGIKG